MINKVLLSEKLASIVKVLKYFGREEYCRLLDEYLMSFNIVKRLVLYGSTSSFIV